MKKARIKILFMGLTFLIIGGVYGQERINREKLSFDTASLVLTEATGWAYNEVEGKWVDYKNIINDSKGIHNGDIKLFPTHVFQNFIQLQFKTVSLSNQKYYVFVVNKWDGKYKYPAIKEGWFSFKIVVGYIFTEDEYRKILNFENSCFLKTKYTPVVIEERNTEKYDEVKFLDLLLTSIQEGEWSTEYTFPILKSTEGNLRFYVPSDFSKYSLNKIDFEKRYFEVSSEEFSKLTLR